MRSPTARAFSTRPSRSIASSTDSAAAAIGGEPPNVVAWSPRSKPPSGVSEASSAPTGNPPASPLATAVASGRTPASSAQNHVPQRPIPVCTSSYRSSAPWRSQSSRASSSHAASSGQTPPSPWIGSTSTAQVSGPTAAASAARSLRATCRKPAGTGSNGSRFAADQPAASVARVRPWKAPSTHTTSCLAAPPRARPVRRASLMAASTASAPELQKNARSCPESAQRRSASVTEGSV